MEFRSPMLFWLFVPFAGLVAFYFYARWRRKKDLFATVDTRLIRHLVSLPALRRRKWKERAMLLGLMFLIVAATGPQWGPDLKEVKQRGVDVFIAIDLSRSMLAEDIAPSRLDRAKQSLSLLLQKLSGNRVGIIAFAGYAAIQCPLTIDTDAARMILENLDTNVIGQQGTAIGDALRLAASRFDKDEHTGKAVVLLTDGEDHHSDPVGGAQALKEKSAAVFAIGIGTTKGDVIKKKDERGKVIEFMKHDGEMVLSRMDDSLLSKIAATTGGRFYRASSTDQEVDEIADMLNSFDKKEFGQGLHQSYKDRYQWFVLLALLLLIGEFFISETPGQAQRIREQFDRRRWKFSKFSSVTTVLLIFLTNLASGAAIDHIRDGNRLLRKGDLAGARGEFESALIDEPESPIAAYNLGTAEMVDQKYDEAQKHLEQAASLTQQPSFKSRCLYNLGELKFVQGDRAAAVEKFKEALRLDPKDVDAKYNIEYLLAGKTPPQQKPNPSPSGNPSPQDGQDKKNQGQGQSSQDQQKKDAAQKEKEANEKKTPSVFFR